MGLYDSFRKLRHSVYVSAVDRDAEEYLRKRFPGADISPVSKGKNWVLKYRLSSGGEKLFVRVFPRNKARTVLTVFDTAAQLSGQGCSVIRPLDAGSRFIYTYYIEEWTDGKTVREYYKGLDGDQRSQTGVLAGRELGKFHSAQVGLPLESLTDRIDLTLDRFKRSPHGLYGLKENFLAELGALLPELKKRPQVLLHGDCHPGNIMTDAAGRLYLTDLETVCTGDPLYDLACLMEKNKSMLPFNEGLLKGYGLEPGKTELRFIGIYHVIRKLEEFNYHINNLPDHLSSREQWEKRLAFLSDAEAVKQALLPAGNVE